MAFAQLLALALAASIVIALSEAAAKNGNLAGQDKKSLFSIRNFLLNSSPNSTLVQKWLNQSHDPCLWPGIECSYRQSQVRVTELNLSNALLNGRLPPAVANLTALTELTVSNNAFTGTIPHNLGKLLRCSLGLLDLSSNKFAGEISPLLFSGCPRLHLLNLSGNALTGGVPQELERCRNLRRLLLSRNQLTGRVPVGLLNGCGNLRDIDLEYNNLTGPVPAVHVSCSSLVALRLTWNRLTGQLPPSIARLAKLQTLMLGKNGFQGGIPPEFARLTELRLLSIDNNNLSGTIPQALGHMTRLESLFLHKNRLNGSIPKELAYLPGLRNLDLNKNSLTGSIPPELGNIPSLILLFLASNDLTGSIPLEIGNLTALQGLDLSGNRLTGSIPATVENLQSLLWLSLSHNRLQGPLPPEIVNCGSLVWLNLGYNRLSGNIPSNIGLIGSRANETFARNREKKNPVIPENVGECWAMAKWFPEEYPFIYDTFKRVRCNDFWDHILGGTIKDPICIKKPHFLQVPAYVQLSGNRFTGKIPESLGNHTRLWALLLADNLLSGQIPEAITVLSNLSFFNLSHNNLTGTIPEDFAHLECLQLLDLSVNNLSGTIPAALGSLTSLTSFNVSYNEKLHGPVPTGGQLLGFVPDSYLGDPGVLFPSGQGRRGLVNNKSSIPLLKISVAGSNPWKGWVIGGICMAVSAATIVASGCYCLCSWMKRGSITWKRPWSKRVGPVDQSDDMSSSMSFRRPKPGTLTYDNIVKATNNFAESRCIGSGGQGIVYRAELDCGLHVAVKRLRHEDTQADVEFLAEMQTLGGLTHPNLVPILGCCLRGNERILVYKLIGNGSLEDWLHGQPRVLEWPCRLKIAVGSAMALKFLHHECTAVIIHRDIKASNILVDDDFNAYVTDFGLARNQSRDVSHVSTAVAGTLGYLPPEYAFLGMATAKGDVYSFGVILLQLATGMKAIGGDDKLEGALVEWVKRMMAGGRTKRIFDPRLVDTDTWDKESGMELLRVACDCTLDNPQRRPSMMEVASDLQEIHDRFYFTSSS